jgi:hypothetical protein
VALDLSLSLSPGISGGPVYSTEAMTLFAAMTVPPNNTLKRAYNDCIVALKLQSLWTKLDALYLIDVHDAQAARLNVRSPGTYNLTAFSSPAFAAKGGYTGNGSTSYLSCNFDPTTATTPNMVQDSESHFAWSTTAAASSGASFGVITAASIEVEIYPRFTDNNMYGRSFASEDTIIGSGGVSDGSGLVHISRNASSGYSVYKNGSSIATKVKASGAPTSATLALLREGSSFYAGQIAMAGFGAGLSAGDAGNLYSILSTFKTAAEAS